MDRQPGRGRPPLPWLTAEQLAVEPIGTAVVVETWGGHTPRITGRITGHLVSAGGAHAAELDTPTGPVTLPEIDIKRARVVAAVYEPGDLVLKRGVPAEVWRGGVVRSEELEVLVEQIGGEFVWLPETILEAAEGRDESPREPRGPVPVAVR